MKSLILQRFLFKNVGAPWHFEGEGVSREPVGSEAVSGKKEAQEEAEEKRRITEIECSDDLLYEFDESNPENQGQIDTKIAEIKEKMGHDLNKWENNRCLRSLVGFYIFKDDFDTAREYANQVQNDPSDLDRKALTLAEVELAAGNNKEVREIVKGIESGLSETDHNLYYALMFSIDSYIAEKNYSMALRECQKLEKILMNALHHKTENIEEELRNPKVDEYLRLAYLSQLQDKVADIYDARGNKNSARHYRKEAEYYEKQSNKSRIVSAVDEIEIKYGKGEEARSDNEANFKNAQRLLSYVLTYKPEEEVSLMLIYQKLMYLARELEKKEQAADYRQEYDLLSARLKVKLDAIKP